MTSNYTATAGTGTRHAGDRWLRPSRATRAMSMTVLSHRVGAAGLCADTYDDGFYPDLPRNATTQMTVVARRQCSGCPVMDECLELALRYETRTGVSHGIWGGTIPPHRQLMIAARQRHQVVTSHAS